MTQEIYFNTRKCRTQHKDEKNRQEFVCCEARQSCNKFRADMMRFVVVNANITQHAL